MRPHALATSIVTALGTICLSGCASYSPPGSTPAYAGTWNLITLDGMDIFSMLPSGARLPSLTIAADGRITGYTGMNTLSTFVDPSLLANGNFNFGNAVTTGRRGSPQETIVESAFLTDLAKVDYFSISEGTLTMSKGDQHFLVFAGVGRQ